jgi:MFS family permease
MPVQDNPGRAASRAARGGRAARSEPEQVGGPDRTRRARRGAAAARRGFGGLRSRMAGGETGMMRLFDLHATAAAGDTLIAVGLAGTIFFAVPLGEARGNVALYLFVTMVPFAFLAPLIGPLLDRYRHGRRYALATTMLGRAILAYLLADFLDNIALYPAAFGVLALSRAYGVARAAAVPRLLPRSLTLSQVNARGSVYGTLAGLVVLPLGLAAFTIGPGWPLRVAAAIFLVGMVIALRLPPRADSDQPETLPRLFQLVWLRRGEDGDRVLRGRLVFATMIGSAGHRALYGFLLIFLAFAIRAGELPTQFGPIALGDGTALGVVSGSLVLGTFLAVAGGSRVRIRRPVAIQASGLIVVALLAVLAAFRFTLPVVTLLCLVAAVSSGLAKLAVDSSIQERIDGRLRATAFAHSETLLMLAFVAGSALGLIPLAGRIGVGIAAGVMILAAARAVVVAIALRRDQLSGRPLAEVEPGIEPEPGARPRARPEPEPDSGADTVPDTPVMPAANAREAGRGGGK